MKNVITVTGEVPVADIGYTLMHEHIVSSQTGIAENYPQLYVDGFYDRIMKDLLEMKENGIKTVVEATPYDLGRDVKMLKRVSEESGVNIIACTGWFMPKPKMLGDFSPAKIASCFIDDITKGATGTDIKTGIIKSAMDSDGPTPERDVICRAAGIASKELGMPLMMHSYPQTEIGRHQIRILREEGVPLHRVKIDHCPETTDMNYLCWLADQGVWLGIDRIPLLIEEGSYAVASDTRLQTIKRMLDAGLKDRMLFSHDFMSISTYYDHLPTKRGQEHFDSLNPDRFLYLKNVGFKKLAAMGVDEDMLNQMCIDNPRRFFEGC
ncbi:MAG: phosphotriesterase [Suipraeoptans sp.]